MFLFYFIAENKSRTNAEVLEENSDKLSPRKKESKYFRLFFLRTKYFRLLQKKFVRFHPN
jgi:hypothetical protein